MNSSSAPLAHIADELCSQLSTLRDFLRFAVSRFSEAGIAFGHGSANAYDEAAYLILHSLHLPHDHLEPFLDARLTTAEKQTLITLIERRINERIPAAYLTGEAWLGACRFRVDQRVIVPRSFIAELLESSFAPWVEDPFEIGRVLDLCTGSGCLAILAALAFPAAQVDAVDLSQDALAVARDNVADYHLQERLRLLHSDLFSALGDERYDLIISNPPYVNAEAMSALPAEYHAEPQMALAGGKDGLDLVRVILKQAYDRLNPGGLLVVEIGHNREALEAAFPQLPFVWLDTQAGNEYVFLLMREALADLR